MFIWGNQGDVGYLRQLVIIFSFELSPSLSLSPFKNILEYIKISIMSFDLNSSIYKLNISKILYHAGG